MSRRALQCVLGAALLVASSAAWAGLDQSKNPADAYPSDVASAWFDTLYDVVKTERTAPPPASRIYGITSVALYESVVGGSFVNRSLVGQLNDLGSLPMPRPGKKYHWPTVANSALATVIHGLYPAASQTSAGRAGDHRHCGSGRTTLKRPYRSSLRPWPESSSA